MLDYLEEAPMTWDGLVKKTDSKKEVLPPTRSAGRPLSRTYSPVTLEPAGGAPGPDGQGEKVAIAGSI